MNTNKFDSDYKLLNTEQKKAVDTIEGPVMVIAGPGTGKTKILTMRIANILLQTDIKPEQILAITFTNAGVYSMREKLIDTIGETAYRINIFTFHSFCEHIINEFDFYFPEISKRKPIDELEKVKIFEEIIKENNFKEIVSFYDELDSINRIKGAIDDIKKEGLDIKDFAKRVEPWKEELLSDEDLYYKRKYKQYNVGDIKPSEKKKVDNKIAKAKELVKVFEIYEEKLKEKKFYDFHDMILVVIKELEKNEDLRFDLMEKYQYLLVDEHQDTNEGQNKLIELLTSAEHLEGRANIFTVGDEKQSIYRFQGASIKTFEHLSGLYNDIEKISLKNNYRSTQNILDSSHSLIINNAENKDSTELQSNTKDNNNIEILEFSNYKYELLYLAEKIKSEIENGKNPDEIAVIYRKNKHLDDIKHIFAVKNIPFTVMSKDNVLEDKHIKNLLLLLKVIDNPNDNQSLGKVLFADFLKLDSYDVVNVLQFYAKEKRKKNSNLFSLLSKRDFLVKSGVENLDMFIGFANTIKELKSKEENSLFLDFLKNVLDQSGYTKFITESKDGISDVIKLDKIFDEIRRQKEKSNNYSLKDFLYFIDSYFKYNLSIDSNDPEIISGVRLMTAHSSKGLEFEDVYIMNVTRNNWEKQRGFPKFSLPIDDYKGDEADERRLFYVAMTRAKRNLTITSSKTDWDGKEQEKSIFIKEVGVEAVDDKTISDFEKNNLKNLSLFLYSSQADKSIWNKEFLWNLFLKRGLNVTAINNYLSCPIKYMFRNLLQLPSGYSNTLLFGTVIHSTLEEFFAESREKKSILSKTKLLDIFDEIYNDANFSDYDFERYRDKGVNLLGQYYDNYNQEWTYKISTEENVKKIFELNPEERIKLSGNIDKIEYLKNEEEGPINIVDYKTGKAYSQKKKKEQKEALDRQIVFYHYLLDGYKEGKYRVENAILDFVEKNEDKDIFEQRKIDVTDKDIEDIKNTITNIADEIKSGEFIRKGCQKKDCEYCSLLK